MVTDFGTDYTPEQCTIVFNELSNSTSGLNKICKDNNISPPRFREFILRNAEAGTQYTHARSLQIENLEERVMALGDELALALTGKLLDEDGGAVVVDSQAASAHVALCRVRIDSVKWILSKLVPKKYGDKLDLTSDNKPLQAPSISMAEAKAISKQLNEDV